jgi:hypothetical protein
MRSPTAGVGLSTLPPTDIQRRGALRGSIPAVFGAFPAPPGGPKVPHVAALWMAIKL